MHRISTTPGPSSFNIGTNYKVNSSPAPRHDALAPDPHVYTSASAIGAGRGARRRVASEDDAAKAMLDDPWGDSQSASSSGRTGLRSRSRSHSTHANGQHPLQANGNGNDAADTRPGLRRMLSSKDGKGGVWGFSDGWVEEEPEDEGQKERPSGTSREMLVHKVQPKDSLAGVALRYGVSLADIRKVNKLWAADSIHLRSVLYIPLNANLKLGYSTNLIDLRTPDQERDAQLSPDRDDASTSASSTAAPPEDKPTIQHVPVSELSFFPPPTSPRKTKPRTGTMPRSVSSPFGSTAQLLFTPGLSSATLNAPPFFSAPSQLSSSPRGTGTLSSLFSALPIPDAVQRLSIDSIAGGALTPRAASSASDISDQLVELNTISTRPGPKPKRTIRTQPTQGPVMTVPRHSVEGGDGGPRTPGLGFAAGVNEDW